MYVDISFHDNERPQKPTAESFLIQTILYCLLFSSSISSSSSLSLLIGYSSSPSFCHPYASVTTIPQICNISFSKVPLPKCLFISSLTFWHNFLHHQQDSFEVSFLFLWFSILDSYSYSYYV